MRKQRSPGANLLSRCLALLGLLALTASAGAQLDADQLQRDVQALLATPHRLAGTAPGRQAGDYLLAQLRAAGVAQVLVQPLAVTQMQMQPDECYVEAGGQRWPLQPLRPNGVALAVTPAEGLAGPSIYLHEGDEADFARLQRPAGGWIAVLDYAAGNRWQRAFALGAVAVVLVGPMADLDASRGEPWLEITADFPRFYLERDDAQAAGLLTGATVRLFCRQQWVQGEGRNIYALLPGTAGATGAGETPLLAVTCEYDSYGPAPYLSPQPRKAGNVALALALARQLARQPAPRPVLVCFFDNGAQSGAGVWQFLLARSAYLGGDAQRIGSLAWGASQREQELANLAQRLAAVEDSAALLAGAGAPGVGDERRQLLRDLEQRYNDLRDEIYTQKVRRQRLEKQKVAAQRALDRLQEQPEPSGSAAEDWRARRATLLARISGTTEQITAFDQEVAPALEQIETQRQALAQLRQEVENRKVAGAAGELLNQVLATRQATLRQRQAEAQREIELFHAAQAAVAPLDSYKLVGALALDLEATSARWTLTAPSATRTPLYYRHVETGQWSDSQQLAFVTNPGITRWLREAAVTGWSGTLGLLEETLDDDLSDVEALATATYVLKLNHLGRPRQRLGMPNEPVGDLPALARHGTEVARFIAALAGHAELERTRVQKRSDWLSALKPSWEASQSRYKGSTVNRYGGAAVEPDIPVGGAVVQIGHSIRGSKAAAGDRYWGWLQRTTVDGLFDFVTWSSTNTYVMAARFDEQGRINGISQLRAGGYQADARYAPTLFYSRRDAYPALFNAQGTALLQPWPPFAEVLGLGDAARLLDGIADTPIKRMHVALQGPLMALWLERADPFKMLTERLLMLGADQDEPTGSGVAFQTPALLVPPRAAGDIWTLNEDRLDKLRRHGILQNDLELLHAQAQRQLDVARQQPDPTVALAQAAYDAAMGYAAVAYMPIRTVTNDLIKAVVILLLLAIPFAFSLERLVLGSVNVYRQIAGFIAIFLTVFGILYAVHPAFQFASFPIVVLLAFVIIIMSGMVIYIMWSKFEYEIRSFQGVATASHRSTRSGRGTFGAAVALGISTMRRRPLRTFLTALTIVLLTFTILFFGAFNSEMGLRRVLVGPGGGSRPQIELSLSGARALSAATVGTLRTLFADQAQSYVRRWHTPPISSELVGRLADDELVRVQGWASVHPHDLTLYPALRSALRGDVAGYEREGGIFLPVELAAKAATPPQPGSTIQFLGESWIYRGVFDPDALLAIKTIEGAGFVPLDVEEMERLLQLQNPKDAKAREQKRNELEVAAFPQLAASRTALLWRPSTQVAEAATTLVLLPHSDEAAWRIAGVIATLLGDRVTVSAGGEVQRVLYTRQLSVGGKSATGKKASGGSSFAGFTKLLAPLVLGGLIIFTTLLSSVSDREREIFTFSALGLAPVHVAVLFFAEAAVYAVIGGLGGYLFSQVFGKTVEQMALWGWVTAPSMNYSSMNAMVAILIVMLTVMVSTIYPAFKASRSANPGIQRRWRMPDARGDELDILFPFTVSEYDLVGVVSFLEEYFLSHQERSVGSFAADEVVVERVGDSYVLRARTWLQPFDQGVSQTFALRTEPSDIDGIDQVHLRLERLTGSPAIWQRSAKVFVNDLRQQFIFWRTIDEKMMEHYRELTLRRFGGPAVTEQTHGA